MITILDSYIQTSFEYVEGIYKYTGTYNVKDEKISLINITIYKADGLIHQGNMTATNTSGVSISVNERADLQDLTKHVDVFLAIRSELQNNFNANVL